MLYNMEHAMLLTHESWVAEPTSVCVCVGLFCFVFVFVIWCCTLSRHFEKVISTSRCKTVLVGQLTSWQEAVIWPSPSLVASSFICLCPWHPLVDPLWS